MSSGVALLTRSPHPLSSPALLTHTAPTAVEGEPPRVVSIPVHYGGADGPDIDAAARVAGLASADDVAREHSGGDYR